MTPTRRRAWQAATAAARASLGGGRGAAAGAPPSGPGPGGGSRAAPLPTTKSAPSSRRAGSGRAASSSAVAPPSSPAAGLVRLPFIARRQPCLNGWPTTSSARPYFISASASRPPAAAAAAGHAASAADAAADEASAGAAAPAPSSSPTPGGVYRVEVVTGDVRGAETTAAAAVRLVGENGRSEEFVLGNDQDEYGFERGSRQAYELTIPAALGRLVRVEVAQVPPSADQAGGGGGGGGPGSGWFLDRLCVTPPGGAAPITFPCAAWLGSNDEYESRQAAVMARELVPEGGGGGPAAAAGAAASAPQWAANDPIAAAAAAGAWGQWGLASGGGAGGAPPLAPPQHQRPRGGRAPAPPAAPLPLSMAFAGSAPHRSRPVPAPAPALAFDVGAAALPHPDKVKNDGPGARGVCRAAGGWAGEDAYFTAVGPPLPLPPGVPSLGSSDGSATTVRRLIALGVADGVYAWREAGIDAGAFSRTLMSAAAAQVAAGVADPAAVLAGAEAATLHSGVQGSATACVILLDPARGALTAANVGDSGFAVAGRASAYGLTQNSLTGGEISLAYNPGLHQANGAVSSRVIKFKSPQQEHEFGRPYQLGHHGAADCAGDAMLATLPVAPGDVVILGSDGLWDNLGDDGLLAALDQGASGSGGRWVPEAPAALARRLAAAAFAGSVDKKGMTPYSVSASAAFNMIYSGGKADDITVVVARVRERREADGM